MGHDFAGIVDAVGSGVNGVRAGDEVFGIQGISEAGAFAEYLVTKAKNVYTKPTSLTFEQASAVPMTGVTAWSAMVDKAKVKKGQAVFVTGCLGGVGRAAVQIAIAHGAAVFGNCSASGIEEALALGIQQAFDYRTFNPADHRHLFDVVIDPADALSVRRCDTMRTAGGIAVHLTFPLRTIVATLTSRHHAIAAGAPTPSKMAGIAGLAEQGALVPKIAQTVALTDAVDALTELETKGTPKGKLVILCGH